MEIYGLNQQQASSSVTIEDRDDDYINSIKSDLIPRVQKENQSQGTIFEIKKVTPPPKQLQELQKQLTKKSEKIKKEAEDQFDIQTF